MNSEVQRKEVWTEAEEELLRGMWQTEATDLIAMTLERTQQAVRQRASMLGLKRPANWDKMRQEVRS